MLTDLREMISELREQYREAWLEEATPFRLQSALYRWDAEWDYWTAMQRLLVQQPLAGSYYPSFVRLTRTRVLPSTPASRSEYA